MRATRGLFASLGASTALVLAAAVALFSVSTIVAFRGWPGVQAPPPVAAGDRITVASSHGPGMAHGAASNRIVVPEARIARRRGATPPSAYRASVPAATSVVSRPWAAVRRRIPDSVRSPAATLPSPATSDTVPREAVTSPPGDGVREVGSGIGGTVGGVAGGLGDAVRPVSPALGRTLDQAGRSVEQTIGGVADALGTSMDVLTGALPR